MHTRSANTFNHLYYDLVQDIREMGLPRNPRGQACKELRPGGFEIQFSADAIYGGRSRKLNMAFLALETLSYIAGWGDKRHADLLCAVNSNMRTWVNEETGAFDGAYGPRIVQQLPRVVEQLARDPDCRQAVIAIWDPAVQTSGTKDIPCTVSLQFFQTWKSQLGALVNMRSNDINWGVPYDVAAFCSIQCLIADCLGWTPGRYTHVDGSLHLYEATPPSVVPRNEEQWKDFYMPRFLLGRSSDPIDCIHEVIGWSKMFLDEAYAHFVVYKIEKALFQSTLETVNRHCLAPYFKAWANLVRHTW